MKKQLTGILAAALILGIGVTNVFAAGPGQETQFTCSFSDADGDGAAGFPAQTAVADTTILMQIRTGYATITRRALAIGPAPDVVMAVIGERIGNEVSACGTNRK